LLTCILLLVLIAANPISTHLEESNTALRGTSTCWDGGQCRNPYSCSWDGVIVPCVKTDSTGEIVEASTGIVIGYLAGTSTLANDTILLKDPITSDLQRQAVGGFRDLGASEPTVEARIVAGNLDQEDHTSTAPGNQLEKRHEYDMRCGDNNGPKYKRCSGFPCKYYCKSTGVLDNLGDDSPYCDDWCSCQKVFIKYCPFSDNTIVVCVGIPIGEVANQTTTLPNGTLPHNNGASTRTHREVAEAVYPEVAPESGAAEPAALTKRHNFALDCSSATAAVQKECKDFGYYCDAAGKVQAQYGRFISCDVDCECRTMANCLVNRWEVVCYKGKLVANASDVAPVTFPAQIIDETSVLLKNGTVLSDVHWA
jgi:hypothetical protein